METSTVYYHRSRLKFSAYFIETKFLALAQPASPAHRPPIHRADTGGGEVFL